MSTANPIIQGKINGRDPEAVRKAIADIGALIDEPINSVYATAGTQSTGDRDVTFQVRDRLKNTRSGRQIIAVWVSATEGGAASASPTWGSATAGTLIRTDSNIRRYITDDSGKVTVPVTASAATWYFSGIWVGRPTERPLVWA